MKRALLFLLLLLNFGFTIKAQTLEGLSSYAAKTQCEAKFQEARIRLDNQWMEALRNLNKRYGGNGTSIFLTGDESVKYDKEKESINAWYRSESKNIDAQINACAQNAIREYQEKQRQMQIALERKRIEEEMARIQAEKKRQEQERVKRENERIAKENERKRLEAERIRREEAQRRAEEARKRMEAELQRKRELAEKKIADYNTKHQSDVSKNYAASVAQGKEIAKNSVGEVSHITNDTYEKQEGYRSDKLNDIFNKELDDGLNPNQESLSQIEEKLSNLEETSEEDLTALIEEVKRLQAELDAINKANEEADKKVKDELNKLQQEEKESQDKLKEMEDKDKELEKLLKQLDEDSK